MAPTTSTELSEVQRGDFESTDVSGSLSFSPPIERLLRDQITKKNLAPSLASVGRSTSQTWSNGINLTIILIYNDAR